jgi:hypothetical protein
LSFLFGPEREELKTRMELIIKCEEKTVKTLNKHIEALNMQKAAIENLAQAIRENTLALEKLCAKL